MCSSDNAQRLQLVCLRVIPFWLFSTRHIRTWEREREKCAEFKMMNDNCDLLTMDYCLFGIYLWHNLCVGLQNWNVSSQFAPNWNDSKTYTQIPFYIYALWRNKLSCLIVCYQSSKLLCTLSILLSLSIKYTHLFHQLFGYRKKIAWDRTIRCESNNELFHCKDSMNHVE